MSRRLRPTIYTVGRQADVAAVTDVYSECEFFTPEFRAVLVTSTYRPNAVQNLKAKLGDRLFKWWYEIVRTGRDKNTDPAELRKEIMQKLLNYETELKTSGAVITFQNNSDVPDSLQNQWMHFVRLKYIVYLRRYDTDMKSFLSDVYNAVSFPGNFGDYIKMMDTLGMTLSSDEESEAIHGF
ncbi:hypothetical protein HA402_010865 [Bradysia odoriphaga]|nr:hypothetical protein HA402_010865 [Bradysia odoriphaga]